MIKKVIAAVAVLSFGVVAQASYISENFTGPTYYVDCKVATTGDGSESAPFKTLQEALNAATVGGCTVILAEGTYDSGVMEYDLNGETTRSRGVILHKTYLKGAGRDKTFIVGAKATTPDADGNGADAVRCLLFDSDGEGSLVEGLTLKGGRTKSADLTQTSTSADVKIYYTENSTTTRISDDGVNKVAKGGAVFAVRETSGGLPIILLDATFDDCCAGYCGGAVYGNAVLIRGLVKYCRGALLHSGAVAGIRGAFSSIFTHCGGTANGGANNQCPVLAWKRAMNDKSTYVNCTFASNRGPMIAVTNPFGSLGGNAGFAWYNTAMFDTYYRSYDNGDSGEMWNCVMNTNGSAPDDAVGSAKYNPTNIGGDWSAARAAAGQRWLAGVNNETGAEQSSAKCDEYGWDQLVSIHYDFRPRENCFILDKGDVKWLTGEESKIDFVPTEYQDKDFEGAPRVGENDRVAMGAYNNGVKLGVLYSVTDGLGKVKVNGYTYGTPNNKTLPEGLYGVPGEVLEIEAVMDSESDVLYAAVPSWDRTTVNGKGETVSDSINNANYDSNDQGIHGYRCLFPSGRSRTVYLTIEPKTKYPVTYTFTKAASVKWVSPDGHDDTGDGTEGNPYETLQKAVDASSANGVVFAKAGVYDKGGKQGTYDPSTDGTGDAGTTWDRVNVNKVLRICGIEGAAKTFIVGRDCPGDPSTTFINKGCGPEAMRCIQFGNSLGNCLQGFTLTGGRVGSDPIGTNKAWKNGSSSAATGNSVYRGNYGGAGVMVGTWNYGNNFSVVVQDCVVTNCIAYWGAATYGCFLERCEIVGNDLVDKSLETNNVTEIGGILLGTRLVNSVIRDNAKGCGYGSILRGCGLLNCVVDEKNEITLVNGYEYTVNTIFLNGTIGGNYGGVGNIVWPSAGSWTVADQRKVVDPQVYTSTKGKYYPLAGGNASTGASTSHYAYWFKTYDADGVWLGETPCSGCRQKTVVSAISLGENPNESRFGQTTVAPAVNGLFEGESIEVTVSVGTNLYNVSGYKVNGEPVADSAGLTFVRAFTGAAGENWTITPVFATSDWYVDATNGDDANHGWSKDDAKKTLNAILPLTMSGETVHAAEGVYEGNEMLAADLAGSRLPFVGIIPNGVTLVADGEQGKTVVKGRWGGVGGSTNPYYTTGYQNMTFGDDAIRCLKAGANTKIKGLTIYNGGAHNTKYKDGTSTVAADRIGAGVYGTATTVFEDCFFSNLVAYTQAGFVGGGTAIRCKFIRLGSDGSGVCSSGKLYNCYIDRCFDSPVNGASVVKNCTLGPNNRVSFTSGDYPNSPINIASGGVLENTIMLIPNDSTATNINLRNVRNCIFEKSNQAKYNGTTWDANSKFVDAADVKLDADGHLCVGSVAIDAGVNDSLEEGKSAGIDLDGNKRISHKVVDVGCYEYMYRPTAFVKGIAGGIDPAEDVLVEIGSTQIVTATDDKRNLLSFEVKTNGVDVALEPGTRTFSWTPTDEDDDLYVTATYATNWYVNAEAADDSGNGWTPETAKKTLAAVMEAVIAGDCVHAAPGVYNEGSMKHSDQCWLNGAVAVTNKCRVAIPEGAALVADGTAANTIIEGYKVAGSPSWPNFDSSGFGFSPDALRGVAMNPNSYLKGFTITNCSVTGSAAAFLTGRIVGARSPSASPFRWAAVPPAAPITTASSMRAATRSALRLSSWSTAPLARTTTIGRERPTTVRLIRSRGGARTRPFSRTASL